jgi:hypothetical protein
MASVMYLILSGGGSSSFFVLFELAEGVVLVFGVYIRKATFHGGLHGSVYVMGKCEAL